MPGEPKNQFSLPAQRSVRAAGKKYVPRPKSKFLSVMSCSAYLTMTCGSRNQFSLTPRSVKYRAAREKQFPISNQNPEDYTLFPNRFFGQYNSNSFIRGLLQAAGFEYITSGELGGANLPGWDYNGVPAESFGIKPVFPAALLPSDAGYQLGF
ncbi:MAG TPA: hypothetical protein VG167_15690 [Verrucomicrobiae bacterium]|nr:hypothetical protein [Verrucomicrobiae bacterium]